MKLEKWSWTARLDNIFSNCPTFRCKKFSIYEQILTFSSKYWCYDFNWLNRNILREEHEELKEKFYSCLRDPYLYLSFLKHQEDYEKIKDLYALLEGQEFIEHKIVQGFDWETEFDLVTEYKNNSKLLGKMKNNTLCVAKKKQFHSMKLGPNFSSEQELGKF